MTRARCIVHKVYLTKCRCFARRNIEEILIIWDTYLLCQFFMFKSLYNTLSKCILRDVFLIFTCHYRQNIWRWFYTIQSPSEATCRPPYNLPTPPPCVWFPIWNCELGLHSHINTCRVEFIQVIIRFPFPSSAPALWVVQLTVRIILLLYFPDPAHVSVKNLGQQWEEESETGIRRERKYSRRWTSETAE